MPGAPNSTKFKGGGGGLQRTSQDTTKGRLQQFFTFYAIKNITF